MRNWSKETLGLHVIIKPKTLFQLGKKKQDFLIVCIVKRWKIKIGSKRYLRFQGKKDLSKVGCKLKLQACAQLVLGLRAEPELEFVVK
jgi:hypothetical protein